MRLRKRKQSAAYALVMLSMGCQAAQAQEGAAATVDDAARTVRVTGHYDNAVGT